MSLALVGVWPALNLREESSLRPLLLRNVLCELGEAKVSDNVELMAARKQKDSEIGIDREKCGAKFEFASSVTQPE